MIRPAAALLVALLVSPALAENFSVGPQYDTTHVYLASADIDRFVTSFTKTFGGASTPQVVATVTPTPSETTTQLLKTPVGTLSVFGFRTPVPYPFGAERNGYLVTDVDDAVAAAQETGASLLVAPFDDPIGRDAVVLWPGGVLMQFYWHTDPPQYAELETTPDNRIYLPADRADAFVAAFTSFAGGTVVSDGEAPGAELGRTDPSAASASRTASAG